MSAAVELLLSKVICAKQSDSKSAQWSVRVVAAGEAAAGSAQRRTQQRTHTRAVRGRLMNCRCISFFLTAPRSLGGAIIARQKIFICTLAASVCCASPECCSSCAPLCFLRSLCCATVSLLLPVQLSSHFPPLFLSCIEAFTLVAATALASNTQTTLHAASQHVVHGYGR